VSVQFRIGYLGEDDPTTLLLMQSEAVRRVADEVRAAIACEQRGLETGRLPVVWEIKKVHACIAVNGETCLFAITSNGCKGSVRWHLLAMRRHSFCSRMCICPNRNVYLLQGAGAPLQLHTSESESACNPGERSR
jgi:hypothetical protein